MFVSRIASQCAVMLLALVAMPACAREQAVRIPAPTVDDRPAAGPLRKAVLAGGCFWGVQGVYQHLKGVRSVLSGYAGGDPRLANYSAVTTGKSGHAESVEIVYDPAQVTYGQILHVFFSVVHDPTQKDRQGPDVGPQYRSAIFHADESQQKIAQAYIKQLGDAGVYGKPIVTRVEPLRTFHEAEGYHQDYLIRNPRNPYIVINDLPKVRSFEQMFPSLYVASPVTVAARGTARAASTRDPPAAKTSDPPGAMMMRAEPGSDAPAGGAMMSAQGAQGAPRTEGPMPTLEGATGWLNGAPLTRESLRGKVVLVDFWAYSCINCLRSMPYVNAWYRHYKDSGLVVIGVHSPEFAFEKDTANVRAAVEKFGVKYPVALDSELRIWKAFNNRFWPAHYFIDAKGQIRGHHFGEGKYARSERILRQLLAEAGAGKLPEPLDDAAGQGVAAPADMANVASPETYVGYARAEKFSSPGGLARDTRRTYELPRGLGLNQWALAGSWRVAPEHARLETGPGRVAFRFKARDLHLVLGPASGNRPVRFRVTLDGGAPALSAGLDTDAQGQGVVREHRLYQLIRQRGPVTEREFVIEFLDPGVDVYSFTFG
jgi:methionine-S-sulfoxide reductase